MQQLARELTIIFQLEADDRGVGALEGGLLGAIVKNQFAGIVSPIVVNIASFLFAALDSGRDKLALLSKLMLLMGYPCGSLCCPVAHQWDWRYFVS